MNSSEAESGYLLLLRAARFSSQRHRSQRRKDREPTPYINHPLAVAALLAEADVTDPALLAAAVLHDTVEDTETTLEEILVEFGEDVRSLVEEVTDDKSLPKARRKQLQVERAPRKSSRAKMLKVADKICNVQDIQPSSPADWSPQRKLEYLDWAERVVAGCRGMNDQLDARFDDALREARRRLSEEPT